MSDVTDDWIWKRELPELKPSGSSSAPWDEFNAEDIVNVGVVDDRMVDGDEQTIE